MCHRALHLVDAHEKSKPKRYKASTGKSYEAKLELKRLVCFNHGRDDEDDLEAPRAQETLTKENGKEKRRGSITMSGWNGVEHFENDQTSVHLSRSGVVNDNELFPRKEGLSVTEYFGIIEGELVAQLDTFGQLSCHHVESTANQLV